MNTQIVNLILVEMQKHLEKNLSTDIPESDPSRVTVVKIGLLQSAKVAIGTAVGVIGGNHEDPNWKDGIVSLEGMENIAQDFDAREVGGGQLWWRRGVAQIECFYITKMYTEEKAFEVAYSTLGRLMANIETVSVSGLVDSFGEQAIKIYCPANTFFQSGGPPNQYIFRGKVYWTVLTERP